MTNRTRLRIAAIAGAASLTVAALAGCGSDSGSTSTAASTGDAIATTVTEANGATESASVYRPGSGTVVNETLGATFAIELSQSPSTGYTWKAAGGTAASLVELIDEDVETEGDAPGSPGTHVFAYRASAEGEGTLVFEEFAPGSDTASDTVAFEVSVGAP